MDLQTTVKDYPGNFQLRDKFSPGAWWDFAHYHRYFFFKQWKFDFPLFDSNYKLYVINVTRLHIEICLRSETLPMRVFFAFSLPKWLCLKMNTLFANDGSNNVVHSVIFKRCKACIFIGISKAYREIAREIVLQVCNSLFRYTAFDVLINYCVSFYWHFSVW